MNNKASIEITPPERGQIYRRLDDGTYIFWFDSHTIQNFSTCEQYFKYHSIDNYRRNGGIPVKWQIGTWWSSVMEYFYTLRPQDKPFTVDQIIACAGRSWVRNNMDDCRATDPDTFDKFALPMTKDMVAKALGQATADLMMNEYKKKAAEIRGKVAELKDSAHELDQELVKVYEAAAERWEKKDTIPIGPIIMAVKYFNSYATLDARQWKVIAAERAFGAAGEVFVGEEIHRTFDVTRPNSGIIVFYMGKPDLVVYEPETNLLMPVDHKTKDSIPYNVESIWKPHPQTAGYIFAVRSIAEELGYDKVIVDRCVINIAGRIEPGPKAKNQRRFHRVRVSYSVTEIEEWRKEIMLKAWRLRDAIENNQFMRRESACHLYNGCNFRGVCSQPPSNRPLVLQSDFTQSEPWSPYNDED